MALAQAIEGGIVKKVTASLRHLHWFEWAHNAYVGLALLGMIIAAVSGTDTAKEMAFQIAILVYFLVLLVVLIGAVYMYGKKAKYAEAMKAVHDATHAARDAYMYLSWCLDERSQFEPRYFEEMLSRCLTAISTAFSLVSGVYCRASIKSVGYEEGIGFFVSTLARDSASSGRSRSEDGDRGKKHAIKDNTDFRRIYERKASCFFHGNLPEAENYENTSLPTAWSVGQEWPLTYKSTIVLPIRYVYTAHDLETLGIKAGNRDDILYGFLAIDCGARHAFDERYDVELGNAVADALVSTLEAYSIVRERQKPKA